MNQRDGDRPHGSCLMSPPPQKPPDGNSRPHAQAHEPASRLGHEFVVHERESPWL
jgi:hypothetical protein